ncbi:MAG TPA: hypothetical protein VIV11_33275 [Kofleriaceae bacterium]
MTPVNRVIAVALAGLLLNVPAVRAQNAGAEALFREGRTLIKQGNLKAGCDKLEASEKLESSVGTLLNLGDCREKLGKLASAWASFRKAEALAQRDGNDKKRQREAARRAQKLEGDLANITIQVGPKSKSNGLVIKRNGEVVDAAVYGNAIVVDPGSHVVIAEAPGYRPWKMEVSVGKGGKRWVVVPSLEAIPEPPRPAAPVVVTPTPPPHAPPPTVVVDQPAPEPRVITVQRTWSTTRGIAVALGVVGAGAIGTGVYFGNRANELASQSDSICPTTTCDDPDGLRLNEDARDQAFRANVLFIAGGAAVAAATVLWFVGKPDETTVIAPSIGDSHVGASLTGRF